MTVYIYMFGSLSPVIDFAELEINYQTSFLYCLYYNICVFYPGPVFYEFI